MNQGNLESKKDTGRAVQPKDCGFTKPHWCCVCVYVGVWGGCFSCMSGPQLVSGFSSCCVVLLVITGPDTQDRFLICHRWISWWTNQLNPGRPKFIPDPWFNNIFSLLPSSFLPFITPIQNSKCPTPDLQNSFLRHFSGCDHPAPDQSWNCSLARINGASVTAPKSFIRKSVCSKVKGSPLNTSMCVLLCACVFISLCVRGSVCMSRWRRTFIPPSLLSWTISFEAVTNKMRSITLTRVYPWIARHITSQEDRGVKCSFSSAFSEISLLDFVGLHYSGARSRCHKVCAWLCGEHLLIIYHHSCHWNLESTKLRIPSIKTLLRNSVFSQSVPLSPLSPPCQMPAPVEQYLQPEMTAHSLGVLYRVQCVPWYGLNHITAAAKFGFIPLFWYGFFLTTIVVRHHFDCVVAQSGRP